MTKIVSLTGEPIDPDADDVEPIDQALVEMAEDLLARVKSGEIVSFAAAALCANGGAYLYRGGDTDIEMVGRVEQLKLRILNSLDE